VEAEGDSTFFRIILNIVTISSAHISRLRETEQGGAWETSALLLSYPPSTR